MQIIDIFVQIAYNVVKTKGDVFMANSTTNISIRMDADLKAKALFGELGMNLSTAFNIFVRQSLREGKIPFDITLNQPNSALIVSDLNITNCAKIPEKADQPEFITAS